MKYHKEINALELTTQIKQGKLTLAGNNVLKIYGLLNCKSGRRMKKLNRVFFHNEHEAIQLGFRPCGHCLKTKYEVWKSTGNRP